MANCQWCWIYNHQRSCPCEPWSLTELLDYEKEVTGIFLSGHPLDNFKFEMQNYGITQLSDFIEIKDMAQPNTNRSFRLAGLAVDAQHRVMKTGREFGALSIEDYSGKCEFMLWEQ